jgi:hypothetical protein
MRFGVCIPASFKDHPVLVLSCQRLEPDTYFRFPMSRLPVSLSSMTFLPAWRAERYRSTDPRKKLHATAVAEHCLFHLKIPILINEWCDCNGGKKEISRKKQSIYETIIP